MAPPPCLNRAIVPGSAAKLAKITSARPPPRTLAHLRVMYRVAILLIARRFTCSEGGEGWAARLRTSKGTRRPQRLRPCLTAKARAAILTASQSCCYLGMANVIRARSSRDRFRPRNGCRIGSRLYEAGSRLRASGSECVRPMPVPCRRWRPKELAD
jgi:hypothetical protein